MNTNTSIRRWLLAALFLLFASAALAADTTASPLSVAAAKKVAPKLPSYLLPVLAPVLGFVIGFLNNLVTAHSSNLWLAAGLGLLGVAVRELKEGIMPAPNGGWPVTGPTTPGA